MKTNREIDALVAEKVMGWKRVDVPKDYDGLNAGAVLLPTASTSIEWAPKGAYALWHFCPLYSTDISAAWQVVEKMQVYEDGYDVIIEYRYGRYFVAFFPKQSISPPVNRTQHKEIGMAICKAVLMAVGVEVESPK